MEKDISVQHNVHGEPGRSARGRGKRIRERRVGAGHHRNERTRVTRYATPTHDNPSKADLRMMACAASESTIGALAADYIWV